jgi:hypothetical protein
VKIIAPIFFISNDDPIDIQVLISKYWYPSIDIQLKCRNYLITIRTKMTIATLPSQRISTLRATPLLLLTCALASFLDVTCFDASWQGKCWPPSIWSCAGNRAPFGFAKCHILCPENIIICFWSVLWYFVQMFKKKKQKPVDHVCNTQHKTNTCRFE